MSDLQELGRQLSEGNFSEVEAITKKLIIEGFSAGKILYEGVIPGMEEVGRLFKNGDMYIPEVLMAAKGMKSVFSLVEPLLVKEKVSYLGKFAIGTVQGDIHDIGKNLVSLMMKGVGFEVIDLGVDLPPERFVSVVKENDIKILGLSALLTTTMPSLKETIDALKASGLRDKVKIMVGGAPVNQKFADEIGADGYAADAGEAAEKAKSLLT